MSCYTNWMNERAKVEGFNNGYGKCKEVSQEMLEAFPELSLRKGVFSSINWGERTHWWLRHEDGRIFDPTARQHMASMTPSNAELYLDLTDVTREEAIEERLVPGGKCINCGEDIWGTTGNFCSKACGDSYTAYLNGGDL